MVEVLGDGGIVTGEIDGAVVRYRGGTVAALREAWAAWAADPAFVTTAEVAPDVLGRPLVVAQPDDDAS